MARASAPAGGAVGFFFSFLTGLPSGADAGRRNMADELGYEFKCVCGESLDLRYIGLARQRFWEPLVHALRTDWQARHDGDRCAASWQALTNEVYDK